MALQKPPVDPTFGGVDENGGWNDWPIQPVDQSMMPPQGQPQPQPQIAPVGGPSFDQISQEYQSALGRAPEAGAYDQYWSNNKNPDWKNVIDSSPEASAYKLRQPGPQPQAQPQAPPPFQPQPAAPGPLAGKDMSRNNDLYAHLKSLMDSGGGFNQDIVNRRTEGAREDLFRQNKQTQANDEAALASRGLIGSGPEATAFAKRGQDVADRYKNAVSNIYADESGRADNRMMGALGEAGQLDQADTRSLIDSYMAQTAHTLGLGNLAVSNMNGTNNYNLGLGQLGLNRDVALNNADNTQIQQLIDLINQLHKGADTSAQGFF